MLKVLENSCRTDIFVALLALSRGRPAELAGAPPEQAVKFFDLAVKCLIKLTKALTPTLEVRWACSRYGRHVTAVRRRAHAIKQVATMNSSAPLLDMLLVQIRSTI